MITGVYIHIPFCLTKCGYCNFFSVPYSAPLMLNYVKTLQEEIKLNKKQFSFDADTVYFGGGTPSLLTADRIKGILDLIKPEDGAEITLEVNPVQITADWVKALTATGINRLSLGVQSMLNENLQALGRKHSAETMPDKIKLLRDNGFDNISLDLLYGLPYFSEGKLEQELDAYLKLAPEHISTYLLTIDESVPFRHWKTIMPDDTATEKQYNAICKTLAEHNWEHYEISNFARHGKASRHNLHYWLDEDCLGLGAGASGFWQKRRYKRPNDLQLWEYSVQRGDILYEKETETLAQQRADFIMMQLRLTRGLDLQQYKERFSTDFVSDFQDVIERYFRLGYMELNTNYIRLTPRAWFVSNRIFRDFV